ncbi:MAG: nicotinate-nucleotide adenylyltransferase [Nitriliruptorales bacterium]|nr:nicotinate-nucleotide adenylyltransferase [Nitriliruptorales bacterium]
MAKIGLLGGSFDPPHVGHLVVAEGVKWALGLDEVWFVVAGDPRHKPVETPAEVRLELTRLATVDNAALVVEDREVRRDGPTFTFDTLSELRAQRPDDVFFFILGSDEVVELPNWHRAEELPDLVTFVAVERPGHELPRAHPVQQRVNIVRLPGIDISSTDLRERYAKGRPTRYLVPDAVDEHVRSSGLYR